jgi:hypothetical protein
MKLWELLKAPIDPLKPKLKVWHAAAGLVVVSFSLGAMLL